MVTAFEICSLLQSYRGFGIFYILDYGVKRTQQPTGIVRIYVAKQLVPHSTSFCSFRRMGLTALVNLLASHSSYDRTF